MSEARTRPDPPPRVLATRGGFAFCREPQWWEWDGVWFCLLGMRNCGCKVIAERADLTVIPHDRNDPEALVIISEARTIKEKQSES